MKPYQKTPSSDNPAERRTEAQFAARPERNYRGEHARPNTPQQNLSRYRGHSDRKDEPVREHAPTAAHPSYSSQNGKFPRPSRPAAPRHPGGTRRERPAPGSAPRPLRREGAARETGGETSLNIPPPGDNVRIIPLGGVEEIGRNMTAIEHGDDIIIVDAGLQFREENTPGIDYILPNTKYLEERQNKVRALIITHGHLDHIGGIPYMMDKIGNPTIYTRNLTALMIKKRQEEFPHAQALDFQIVERESRLSIGSLAVRFFSVTHTIPDSMGAVIETKHGSIIMTGDLKLDHIDGVPSEKEEIEFGQFAREKVLLLMADSTNVERPGWSIPEPRVLANIERIIRDATSRLIIGTFASQLERIIRIINYAEELGKKVVVDGRSMKMNIEIARLAGMLKVKKGTLISVEEMDEYPPHKIILLVTGAQGDEFATLMRMANKSHKTLKITKNDTVVLSSSIVPGNERSVQKLKDNLSRQGARIIHYQVSDVHSSGHANRDETLWIHRKVKPKFFIPIHGYHYMLRVHGDIARAAGTPESNIVIPDNGMVIDIVDNGSKIMIRPETAPKGLVMVDGFAIGDIQEVVIRDRQMLASDGMFVIIATIDIASGKVKKSPDIISRGFVYLRESQELLRETRTIIKKTIEDSAKNMHPINFDYLKNTVTDTVSRYLFQQTNKRPIVIPVVLGV